MAIVVFDVGYEIEYILVARPFFRLGGDRLRKAARRGWRHCLGGYFVGGLPPFRWPLPDPPHRFAIGEGAT